MLAIFNEKDTTWADMGGYDLSRGPQTVDTFDREGIHGMLITRVLGPVDDDMLLDEVKPMLIERLSAPDWRERLYDPKAVRAYQRKRLMATRERRVRFDHLDMPESVTLKGVGPLVDIMQTFIEDHRAELEERIDAHIKAAETKKRSGSD